MADEASPAPAGLSGVWMIAGTPIHEPYPCRCHERRGKACSPLWCPCSGRSDPQGPECCGTWNTPQRWKEANEVYQRRRAAGLT